MSDDVIIVGKKVTIFTAEVETIQSTKWFGFAIDVSKHIEEYVIPQYGDEGDDPAQEYSFEDCIKHSQRYLARVGKSSRPGEEKRDLIKAAHYIQKACDRLSMES